MRFSSYFGSNQLLVMGSVLFTNNCSLGSFLGSCSQYSHEIPGYSPQQRRREPEQDKPCWILFLVGVSGILIGSLSGC